MKYLLLIYQNPVTWQGLPESEKQAFMSEVDVIVNELVKSGEWVGGEGLADPSTARTVRVRGGVPAVTDGPYAEAKEQMVGYSMVDCDSLERAIEIAARWPDARLWGIEVRAILSPDGIEMRPPPPSPRSTPRPARRPRPTGRRSWGSTTSSPASSRARS
jgi:hypothetical protein